MHIDIGELIRTLQAGADAVPAAIVAAILLSGPTLLWLLYRFIVQPRARRRLLSPSAMWVCPQCRSVNELRNSRCYRCDAMPIESDLEVIEPDPVPMTPVGPGRDITRGDPYNLPYDTPLQLETPMPRPTPIRPPAPIHEVPPAPVGPGKPDVAQPRRAVVVGRSRGPNDPSAA